MWVVRRKNALVEPLRCSLGGSQLHLGPAPEALREILIGVIEEELAAAEPRHHPGSGERFQTTAEAIGAEVECHYILKVWRFE
jgi:hypothetical protein